MLAGPTYQEGRLVAAHGVLRTPVRECGILAWPALQNVINDARAHELTVDVHMSGWIVRRGWIVARGEVARLRRMKEQLHRLTEQLS